MLRFIILSFMFDMWEFQTATLIIFQMCYLSRHSFQICISLAKLGWYSDRLCRYSLLEYFLYYCSFCTQDCCADTKCSLFSFNWNWSILFYFLSALVTNWHTCSVFRATKLSMFLLLTIREYHTYNFISADLILLMIQLTVLIFFLDMLNIHLFGTEHN
jgi:hypothetical protein